LLLAAALAVAGCNRTHDSVPLMVVPLLPDRIAGFTGGPLTADGVATRRTYTRDATRIDVTVARFPMSAHEYARWVVSSTADFPQAALNLPPGAGNGFYQCTADPTPSCDLLIQLRAGVHVEIRGGGTSSRDDVDVIARAMPLRELAVGAP
jgi:hypothetical protein